MVLNEINFTFRKGTVTSIRGQSGAGKSTLLYLIAGIDYPTSGQLLWDDTPVKDLSDYRRNVVSIISQSYLLFPTRTVFENVCYPLILEKKLRSEVTERATQLLMSRPEIWMKKTHKSLYSYCRNWHTKMKKQ